MHMRLAPQYGPLQKDLPGSPRPEIGLVLVGLALR
jgi:hypothetical protein